MRCLVAVFTGDGSGDFLMAALHRAGFASLGTSRRPDDGLELRDAYITAAVSDPSVPITIRL